MLVEAIIQTFLFFQIEASLKDLSCLMEQYQVVSNRTKSLHQVSEQLLADQVLLFLQVYCGLFFLFSFDFGFNYVTKEMCVCLYFRVT